MLGALIANIWRYVAMAAALGLAAGLVVQTVRLSAAQKEAFKANSTMANERAAHERAARELSERFRTLEGKHHEQIAKIDAEAQTAIAAADADRARADVARSRLQHDIANYITQHRAAAQARATAGQCATDTATIDLLADLQRRADERAGELASIADNARARGKACERAHDEARAMMEAASDGQAK